MIVHGSTSLSMIVHYNLCVMFRYVSRSACADLFYTQGRTAARKELLDQASSPDECEQLYEESIWCLYALQDEVMKQDNPFLEEDKAVIADCLSCMLLLALVVDC